jgi:hypothetical protein
MAWHRERRERERERRAEEATPLFARNFSAVQISPDY